MVEPNLDRFSSRRSTVYGGSGVVATSQPLAAEAGVETLREGGNAFDAAVATAAALNVVEPTSTGLGGDVFALYRTADGEVGAMRSCGGAPAGATRERVREAVASEESEPDEVEMPFHGPHTVTVPGTARGWETAVEKLGRLTLAETLEPAIRYATEGYPVTEVVAAQWAHGDELFTDAHAREAFLPGDAAPSVGQRVRLPRLGETMREIAEEGADVVYEGHVAESIAGEVQSKGGFLTVDDLAAFSPEFVEPVSTTYRGAEVFELPPNNQGLIALEALNVAEEIGAGEHDHESPARVHAFAESMKRAFHDGHRYITDPEYEEVPPLGSKEWARSRAEGYDPDAPSDVSFGVPGSHAEDADTVLLCVADDEGNLVSYINSRFAGFGSGLVAGDTGIALQNRGASFSLSDGHPNRLEPGKRPFHTLVPAVARFGPEDWSAFGTMGGYMQPQGHVQLVSNVVDYGMPIQRALDEPRWRYMESGRLALEGRLARSVGPALDRLGHDVSVLNSGMFGGAQLVRSQDGVLSGATEPRKDGTVAAY
jgi:gamma-glutamyltranspeptidase/glutathione hydrolase